ncbi:motility-associated protein Scm1 [Spiroplasma monobiae]|uniref:Uncharacterized protein n=1 Tax=Spiroplasma monobiae MQ-1 TaxID=1336748 RepID=A0A2K9LUA5_SPISQ|nr:motility-associated protein Scm1 [Spiroplasma monobiae]AUM62632.1 hypothetical protein SMONO_v1c03830 [Spiroplasma monobiae MQ-1]
MKHRNTYTFAIVITVLLVIAFIVAGTVGKTVDVEAILQYKMQNASWKEIEGMDQLAKNVNSPLSLAFFLFGVGGIGELAGTPGWFGLMVFTVTSVIIIPALLIFFVALLSVLSVLFGVEFVRRDAEVNKIKMIGKWGMYAGFAATFLFALIGVVLFCSIEQSLKQDLNFKFNNYDAFGIMTFLTFLSNGTVFGGVKSELLSNEHVISSLNAGITFLVVLLPMAAIVMMAFASMYIGVFISKRESKTSRFFNWLKNIRIDSLRDYISLNIKNPWIWILSLTFIATVIIPGFVHPYQTTTQILISAINLVSIPLVFSPMIVGYFMAKGIKRFNYNMLMFVQIIILMGATWIFQLNSWIFLKDSMFWNSWMSAFIPFSTCTLSLVSAFGFIKFSDK